MIVSKDIGKNEHFIKKGERRSAIYWLIKGRAVLLTERAEIVLSGGSLIALPDISSKNYISDYVTAEDCKFYMITYDGPEGLESIYGSQKGYDAVFLLAAVNTVHQILGEYRSEWEMASQFYRVAKNVRRILDTVGAEYGAPKDYDEILNLALSSYEGGHDPSWHEEFYREISTRPLDKMQAFFGGKKGLVTGEILSASEYSALLLSELDRAKAYLETNRELFLAANQKDVTRILLALVRRIPSDRRNEVLDVLTDIYAFAEMSGLYPDEQKDMLGDLLDEYASKSEETEKHEKEEEAKDPLTEILHYAGCDMTREQEIRDAITAYVEIPDKTDTSDDTRKIRRTLTNIFYELYKAVFRKSLHDNEVSKNITMFLNFGLLDSALAGEENVKILRNLAAKLPLCESENVYTLPRWLRSIYDRHHEPSKNEFDLDYDAFLRDEKKSGRLTADEVEELRRDQWAKVEYEIDNMVKSNSRTTYGRVLTFCPVLSEHDLGANPESLLVTAEKLETALHEVEETDYSLFYHDELFSDPEHGINSETVKDLIYPNIILMPNAGVKAMMWQECSGIRSNTPARFCFPIFLMSNLSDQMLFTAGRYRWEYCRKVEGVRWNDVTEKSLTGQYCDYLQFYKKNRELNAEAKEKLQQELFRVKNNFREVFVKDYVSWMKYESKGSFRLNKITRDIIMETCPLKNSASEALSQNPVFGKKLERLYNMKQKEKKRLQTIYERYLEAGGMNTEPLERTLAYYDI